MEYEEWEEKYYNLGQHIDMVITFFNMALGEEYQDEEYQKIIKKVVLQELTKWVVKDFEHVFIRDLESKFNNLHDMYDEVPPM